MDNFSLDVVTFFSYRDIYQYLNWFDRLYDKIIEEVRVLNICLQSIVLGEETPYSNRILENPAEEFDEYNLTYRLEQEMRLIYDISRGWANRTVYHSGNAKKIKEDEENIEPPIVLTAFFTRELNEVPDIEALLKEVISNRIKTLESIDVVRDRIRRLRMDIYFKGRGVVVILDPTWRLLSYKYLYHRRDARKYLCLEGSCGQRGFFTVADPYFQLVSGSFGGSIVSSLSTLI